MPKAKVIDRIEYTRSRLGGGGVTLESEGKFGRETLTLNVCPNCGTSSLRLDGGCMSCLSCGWSACG